MREYYYGLLLPRSKTRIVLKNVGLRLIDFCKDFCKEYLVHFSRHHFLTIFECLLRDYLAYCYIIVLVFSNSIDNLIFLFYSS